MTMFFLVGQTNLSTSTSQGSLSDPNNNQVTYIRLNERNEKLLVETRAEMESEFVSNKAHAPLWNKIVQKMASHNVHITPRQTIDKWNNLKKKFNETVDLNNKTGNGREECKMEIYAKSKGIDDWLFFQIDFRVTL